MKLTTHKSNPPRPGLSLTPSEPLWKRAPGRDEQGHPLFDFMIRIPNLRQRGQREIEQTITRIQTVFEHYQQQIVFADLNLKINVLWVTIRPVPGLCLELAAAIKMVVPEALLVASQFEANLSNSAS